MSERKLSVWVRGKDDSGWQGTAELAMTPGAVQNLVDFAQTMHAFHAPIYVATNTRMIETEDILVEYTGRERGGN